MNRHSLDIFSLGGGIAFSVIALAFMVDLCINAAYVFPALLVLLGGLGVYASVRAQRANDEAARISSTGIQDDALQG